MNIIIVIPSVLKTKMSVVRKKNIKFLTLYNSFTANEKIDFDKFIGNGLNGNKRNYNKILSSLKTDEKGIIDFSQTINSRTRWNRLSELSILADKFLTLKSLEYNNFENRYLLLKEYDKRNLTSAFEQKYKQFKNELSKEPVVNYDYNMVNQLDKIYLNHLKSDSDSKKYPLKISESGYNRLGIFLIEILENLIEVWTIKNSSVLIPKTSNEDIYSILSMEKILFLFSGFSKSPNKLYPVIKFLYHIYKSLNDLTNLEFYKEAKKIFFRDLKEISKEKREQYFIYMLNYNIELKNLAISGAAEELFFLIDKKLKEGLSADFKIKNFPLNHFRDIIIISLSLKKYKWTENFIKNYGPLLPPDIRFDTVSIGEAMLLFEKNDFLMCKDLLMKIKRKTPFSFVDVFVLKLKVLYELKNFDHCHSELKKFNTYLRKERITKNLLINYSIEFCKAYSLLLKLNDGLVKNNLINLQYILSKKILIAKKWITLKMEELKY